MTTPATQAASHDDSLAAAKLFIKGLEFELKKQVEASNEQANAEKYDESDTEDGAEGRWFSLERALDLIVGVSVFVSVREVSADSFTFHSSPTATVSASFTHQTRTSLRLTTTCGREVPPPHKRSSRTPPSPSHLHSPVPSRFLPCLPHLEVAPSLAPTPIPR